jgi:excisionase family DNA binding protein
MNDNNLQPFIDVLERRLDTMIGLLRELADGSDTVRLLTRKQAARRLGISVRKLDALEEAGDLRAIRIGRSVRYHPDTLERFIRRRATSR